MTAVSKNVYIDKLYDIHDIYKNKYHRTIQMKPVDVKSGTYIDYGVGSNDKDPKSKVGDYVRITKYKNILAKRSGKSWSEVFVIKSQKYGTVDICY